MAINKDQYWPCAEQPHEYVIPPPSDDNSPWLGHWCSTSLSTASQTNLTQTGTNTQQTNLTQSGTQQTNLTQSTSMSTQGGSPTPNPGPGL